MIAQPPLWALEAGLPQPHPGESFDDYWLRLGLDADEVAGFHEGLERCEDVAHLRAASALARACPEVFRRYCDRRMYAARPHLGVTPPATASDTLAGGVR